MMKHRRQQAAPAQLWMILVCRDVRMFHLNSMARGTSLGLLTAITPGQMHRASRACLRLVTRRVGVQTIPKTSGKTLTTQGLPKLQLLLVTAGR